MNQYIASLANTCLSLASANLEFYAESVPENFRIPALYFPPSEVDSSESALNSFSTRRTIYAKVFASDRNGALEIAEGIQQGIMLYRCHIPLYDVDGKATGTHFKVEPPDARIIDEGMAQITLSYTLISAFPEEEIPKAKSIDINKYYD